MSRVYRERKKSLQLSTQLNAAVQQCNCCCCLHWSEKKLYLCILMIHVCIERKTNLVQFPIDFSCVALQLLLLCWLEKKNLFAYFNNKNGLIYK